MNLYWVGIRESEILNTGNLFKGNICIYGKNSLMTNTRINHNEDKNWEMIDNYFSETKEKLIKEKPDIKFMHYNYSGMIGKDLKNCICYNNSYLIDDLNNKFYTKSYFKNVVPVLDYEIIKGKDIFFNLKIKKRFGTEIVIQEKEGKQHPGRGTEYHPGLVEGLRHDTRHQGGYKKNTNPDDDLGGVEY